MIVVKHRVNSIEELLLTPTELGVEVDVRSNSSGLYLSHDPFTKGEALDDYMQQFQHAFIVLNLKEDGLEEKCLDLIRTHSVGDYFFLDQPAPSLIRRGLLGARDGATRLSEYESFETVEAQAGLCNWVWLDYFKPPSFDQDLILRLQSLELKVCLVSPELHSEDRYEETLELASKVSQSRFKPDAVCTKVPNLWSGLAR